MSDQVPNFRASAWIPYAPNNNSEPNNSSKTASDNMDHDVDMMDAPPISTLSEESGPPPPAPHPKDSHVSKFRVKLKVNRPSSHAGSDVPVTEGRGHKNNDRNGHNGSGRRGDGSRGEGTPDSPDSEEEWDQLADDDDIAPSSSVIGTPSRGARQHRDHASTSSTPARGGGRTTGRGSRGGRGRGRGRGGAAVGATEPPQTIFEIAPSVAHAEHGTSSVLDAGSVGAGSPSPSKAAPRKRAKKTEEKKKAGRKPRASKALMQLQDDAASIASESLAGTAASSPLARAGDFSTPELDPIPLTLPPAGIPDGRDASTIAHADTNSHLSVPQPAHPNQQHNPNQPFTLDPTVPVPVYRLPTKPFLVQAPPKMPAGFAPVIPLDKGPAARAPVRRWRPALRAIRGIAGGQWFAHTWVGEKESVYASVTGRDVLQVQGQGTNAGGAENAVPIQPAFAHGHGHGHGGGGGGGRGRGSANASALASPALSVSKLPGGSSGGGKATARSKLAGTVSAGGGAGAGSTADSSRAGSVDVIPNPNSGPLPEGVSAPGMTIRPLSKMRHAVSATDTEVAIDDAL